MGPELQNYLEHVGQKYGVTDRVRFNEVVTSCVYDDHGKWTVKTDKGAVFVVDFVIAATGILHHPKYPEIPGLEDFAGDSWHTAKWNHEVDLTGKRIGVIGTGSTSHQVVPELVNAGHEVFVVPAHAAMGVSVSEHEVPRMDAAALEGEAGADQAVEVVL